MLGGIIYAIGVTLLIFGFFPVGKVPFAVKGVDIGNIWSRVAGAFVIAGFTMIRFGEGKWITLGIILMVLSLILLLMAMLKYIERG